MRSLTFVGAPSSLNFSTSLSTPTIMRGYVDASNTTFIPPLAPTEPLPFFSQIIWVNKAGNDTTGDGTTAKPYATVAHAMATITDALYEKRYVIYVGPGDYNDPLDLKAWVFVVGAGYQATRINGAVTINDPSWANPGTHSDERAGFTTCVLRGTVTFDFTATGSLYGKIYLLDTNVNQTINLTAFGPVNQAVFNGGELFGGLSVTGMNMVVCNIAFQGGNISLQSSPNCPTIVSMTGCSQPGNLTVTSTGTNAVQAFLYNAFITGTLTVSGANASVSATSSSIPMESNIAISSGGSLIRLNSAMTAVDPAVTALGGGQGGAYQITQEMTNVTSVPVAGDGVKLPSSVVGFSMIVKNNGANNLDVYPPVGSSIDALGPNSPIVLAPDSFARFVCVTTTNWQQA